MKDKIQKLLGSCDYPNILIAFNLMRGWTMQDVESFTIQHPLGRFYHNLGMWIIREHANTIYRLSNGLYAHVNYEGIMFRTDTGYPYNTLTITNI